MTRELDERLFRTMKNDPQKGYIELCDQYLGLVYTISRDKLSQVCSKEDIDEFVCDIFYDFFQQREIINLNKGSIKAILVVFTKRRAINLFNKKVKVPEHFSLYDERLENILMDSVDVERQVEEAEQRKELIVAVKNLGKPDSEILIRKYYLGQTLREISIDLDMKVKTVEKRHERALKKLRTIIGGWNNEGLGK